MYFQDPSNIAHTPTLLFEDWKARRAVLSAIAKYHPRARDRREREWLGELYRPWIERHAVVSHELRFIDTRIGWGVFLIEELCSQGFVGEYVGKIERYSFWRSRQNDYLGEYSLGEGMPTRFIINAERCGNMTRWINHSSTPNLEAKTVYVAPFLHVILLAKRLIHPGEQLTYDYGPYYWDMREAPDLL